ncbi:hypothetical protein Fmac_015409 [Flemingia macrophylla]|uniref:Uncharacterized protein n=1 Tax=Flemingia macrophylla TaxID=520843 RepID=A0ABD1MEH6_9FABA
MANVSDIQEFPYLESDSRKKLDGFITLSDGKNDDMKEVNKYDLRKSLAWDSAFSTSSGTIHILEECIQYSLRHSSSGILETEELFNASNSWHSENDCEIFGAENDQLLSCNYMDPETKTVTGEFNLRKSLAWDSAFFTSEGILNPEELSLLNKGFKKSEIDLLPPIEELRISSEWNCTIDSDGSPLATLEVSTNQIREASNTVKYSPILRRPTVNGNQLERNDKISSIPPSWKFSASSEISDPSSSLKPPKISRRIRRNAPIAPINRVPLLSNEVNGESKTVKASGEVSKFIMAQTSNLSCLR